MTEAIEKEYRDIIKLYIFRILLEPGTYKNFINSYEDLIFEKSIVDFLELNAFLDIEEIEDYNELDVYDALNEQYEMILQKEPSIKETILYKNIAKLNKHIPLRHEEIELLAFFVLVKQNEVLEKATDLLGELNNSQATRSIGKILHIERRRMDKIVNDSVLFRTGFIELDVIKNELERKIDFLDISIPEKLFNSISDILELFKTTFYKREKPSLKIDDFSHIEKDLKVLIPYLKNSVKRRQKGVNILLYGKPGTGKTELAKLLAKKLKRELFEVSYSNKDGEAIEGQKRLKAYKAAQIFLDKSEAILMYDEAEDIFKSNKGFFFVQPMGQKDKAWINKVLEDNKVPTIWITNNIDWIDSAIVRRFDYALELPIPPIPEREKILRKYTKDILSEKMIRALAREKNIAPAVVSRAAKVASFLDTQKKDEEFIRIINNTLKAQGYKEIRNNSSVLSSFYNPAFINCSANLEHLAQGIKKNPNARLCLYGVPGTGKSAFGKYIAEILGKPFVLKKGSDLLSKWLGGTEENIALAFEEAKQEKAVLIFDEVDSFLQDRNNAKASWEVTQVNEMLVQMESFEGVFIATTNLIDNLDKASIRRFDMKLEFDCLKPEQAYDLFCAYLQELGIEGGEKYRQVFSFFTNLTPGDFQTVKRQTRFYPLDSAEEFIERLREEISLKDENNTKIMGFVG